MSDFKMEFEIWLEDRKVKKLSSALCVATIKEVSQYAIEKKVSKFGFFEIIDYHLFNKIRSQLLGNKIFRVSCKSTYKAFEKASNYYAQFLKEREIEKFTFKPEVYEVGVEQVNKCEESVGMDSAVNLNTIPETIEYILSDGIPRTLRQIYDEILEKRLYVFGAQNPFNVVRVELMRHSDNLRYTCASKKKLFKTNSFQGETLYSLIAQQIGDASTFESENSILSISKMGAGVCNETEEQDDETVEKKTISDNTNFGIILENFKVWLIASGKAETTARSYWSSVKTVIREFSEEWSVACEKEDLQKAAIEFVRLLKMNCEFNERNNVAHNQWKSALNALLQYIQAERGLNIGPKGCGKIDVNDNKSALVAQIVAIVKKKGISGAWVDKDILPFISATKRAGWDVLNTNEELIEVPRWCFVLKDDIIDLDEALGIMLKILQGHFLRYNGVSTSKIFYKAVQTQLPVFLNDNDFDDEEKVYCIAKYLFSKCGEKRFVFYMNQYIFENEVVEPKSILGLLVRLAKHDGGFLTADNAKNYLSSLELSDNLTQCMGLNSLGKREFLQYTESEFFYFPCAQFSDEQITIIGNTLDKLFAENPDDNFIILRDISDEWFGFLPTLPCGKTWTPLLLQEVIGQFPQLGYITIKSGLKQDLDTLHAAITSKNSNIKTFSDLVWEFLYRDGCIKEYAAEDLRLKLRDAGIIAGNELIYNIYSALDNDYRFVWRNGNTQVKVLER